MDKYTFEEYLALDENSKAKMKAELQRQSKTIEKFKYKESEIKAIKKLSDFEKEMLEVYKNSHIEFLNYENFSVLNYTNILRPSYPHNGYIAFFSKEELPAIEEYGLVCLIKDCFEDFNLFDTELSIYKGKYIKDRDVISPSCNDIENLEWKDSFIHCVSKLDFPYLKLEDDMYVYYLKYKSVYRENKSSLWKKMNPRRFDSTVFFSM